MKAKSSDTKTDDLLKKGEAMSEKLLKVIKMLNGLENAGVSQGLRKKVQNELCKPLEEEIRCDPVWKEVMATP